MSTAMQQGMPVLAMASTLGYFDMYRSANLPLNLTQAQRDFFGAHTYRRTDKPEAGPVHTEWEDLLKTQTLESQYLQCPLCRETKAQGKLREESDVPHLRLCLALARSTRIRRIVWAATAKKMSVVSWITCDAMGFHSEYRTGPLLRAGLSAGGPRKLNLRALD